MPTESLTEPTRIQKGTKVYQLGFDGKVFKLTYPSGRIVKEDGEPLIADLTYTIPSSPYRWKGDCRFSWKE